MTRQFLGLALAIAAGATGLAVGQHAPKDKASDKRKFRPPVLEQVMKDKLNGKQGKILVLELGAGPGSKSRPHRHPGPVIGYVLDGELEVAVGEDGPVKLYKKGEAWYEPARALHRVNDNPSKTKPARFLAFMLMTTEDKSLVLPAKIAGESPPPAQAQSAPTQPAEENTPAGKVKIRRVLEQVMTDKINGKQGKILVSELEKAPDSGSKPHRHPGPVVGYVLEGELEVAVDDGPVKVYKKGEAWYEPARALHRVSRNPSKDKPARFLAFMLMTTEDKQLVLPAKE